jgi:hypothetical protein
MATNPLGLYGFAPYKCLGGGVFEIEEYQTASNLTILAGEAVVMGSDGYLAVPGITSSAIFGFALDGCTATAATRKKIRIIPAMENYIFKAKAATSAGTLNVTNGYVGLVRSLKVSGSYMGVHPSYAGGSCLTILGKAPDSSWGTGVDLLVSVRSSKRTGQK